MGLTVDIYSPSGRVGSCGGISRRVRQLTLMNVEGPWDPTPEAPAANLVKRQRVGNIVAIPEDLEGQWTSHGGCFVYSCDSRFARAVEDLSGYEFRFPVALHDRVEC